MKNKHNYIVVGPDRCGKSQIAQELARQLSLPYFKPSDEKLTFLNNQSKFVMDARYADPRLVDFMRQTGHRAVLDRGYPCEWVYSKHYSRETDDAALRHVDSLHSQMKTRIIIAYRSNYDSVIDDLDPTLNGNVLSKIEGLYRQFAEWTGCETMFLNVDSEDLSLEISEIFSRFGGNT